MALIVLCISTIFGLCFKDPLTQSHATLRRPRILSSKPFPMIDSSMVS
ncbi:hypothetical protein GLYMA_13G251951v4 [Glycine max]|nr:hypothetical protein GLYMA_13G251951v4 [Glycine max]KAH1103301.1 hypothetical protein GYH30_037324 [Glycine max]